jgi:ribosomal protein L37AE/L43A
MNQKNTKELLESFPQLYWQHSLPCTQTAMCWLFECDDGWNDLIWRLSEEIAPLVDNYNNSLAKEDFNKERFGVVQVKTKFGGLRYYTNWSIKEIDDIIEKYEIESYSTCEFCGKPGTQRGGGWIYTLCDECHIKYPSGYNHWKDNDNKV